jgi:benzoyl-CoA reductase subunit C
VEAFSVALSSVLAPKDEHNRWTEDFLEAREARTPPLSARPRVLVAASMLDDLDLVAAVENSGAWVVADDVCTGSRYFWDTVGEPEPSPVRALARRYLNKLPCPRSVGSLAPRTDHLLSLARDYAVDGVIFYILRCCDAHMFQYPLLKQRLEEAGMKTLFIQGDQTVGIDTPTRNRIEAFTEMLSS